MRALVETQCLGSAQLAVKYDSVPGIAGRALDKPAAIADTLGSDQDPFGIHAIQDVAKSLALLSDQCARRCSQIAEVAHRARRGRTLLCLINSQDLSGSSKGAFQRAI
jgi:hypothetical protein